MSCYSYLNYNKQSISIAEKKKKNIFSEEVSSGNTANLVTVFLYRKIPYYSDIHSRETRWKMTSYCPKTSIIDWSTLRPASLPFTGPSGGTSCSTQLLSENYRFFPRVMIHKVFRFWLRLPYTLYTYCNLVYIPHTLTAKGFPDFKNPME